MCEGWSVDVVRLSVVVSDGAWRDGVRVTMAIRAMIQPVAIGLVVGAALTAIVGFNWGGWVSSGKANEIAVQKSSLAVAEVLTPYCVAAALADPNYASLLDTMKAGTSYDRKAIVSKAGWATPMGATAAHAALADACQRKLTEAV
jgi:hypothetical protein